MFQGNITYIYPDSNSDGSSESLSEAEVISITVIVVFVGLGAIFVIAYYAWRCLTPKSTIENPIIQASR